MSFYDDASLVFLAGGAAGKVGKVYNLKPDGSLGSELIANGGFDSDSGWTKGTGWSISGGVASCDGTQTATTNLNEAAGNGLVNGKTYRIEYTITSYSAGSIRVKAGNTGFGTYRSAAGTYVENLVAGVTTFPTVQFNADADFIGSIDNVSCKEADVADFTFTRGTNLTATRVGKDGYIEKGRENLLKYSNTFNQTGNSSTGWALVANTGGTVPTVTSGQTGYDGSSDAWLLDSANDNYCRIEQSPTYTGVFTFSAYAKAGTAKFMNFENSGITGDSIWFNLEEGSVSFSGAIDATITQVGTSEWYRCSVTLSGTSGQQRIYASTSGTNLNSGVAGNIYIQDVQFEAGLVATDYIETGATTATAGLLEDEPRFDYTGGGCPALLMEPTRTNYFTYSEYASGNNLVGSPVIEENYAISPEGVLNAFRIEDPSGGTYRRVEKAQSKTTDQVDWTFSVFVKKATSPVSSYGGIALAFSGGTANQSYVGFDEYEGTISQLSGAASPTNANRLTLHTPVSYGNYWRFAISVSDTDQTSPTPLTNNNTSVSANLYANLSDDGNSISNSEYKDFVAYGMQLEEGLFPTSYIPTYGSSATRAKENTTDSYDQISTLDLSSSGLNGEDVSWFFEFRNNQDIIRDGSDPNVRVSEDLTNVGALRIYRGVTSTTRLKVVLTANSGTSPTAYTIASDNPKVLIKRTWGTGRIQVYVDGVSVKDEINLNFDRWYKLDLAGHGSLTELKQVLAFPTVLSDNDSEILTGATSYSSFAAMATSTPLNYTIYE